MPYKDPEAKRAADRRYMERNRESRYAVNREWKRKNRDKVKDREWRKSQWQFELARKRGIICLPKKNEQ